jgi:hypothetical protein
LGKRHIQKRPCAQTSRIPPGGAAVGRDRDEGAPHSEGATPNGFNHLRGGGGVSAETGAKQGNAEQLMLSHGSIIFD